MSKFTKHLGQSEPIVIEGDEFLLKPLTTESIPDFFRAMKAFSGAGEGASTSDVLANIDDAGLAAIENLINQTLQKSYPDEWKKDEDELKSFGLKYMHLLISKIFEINSAAAEDQVGGDTAAIKRAEQLKSKKQQDE